MGALSGSITFKSFYVDGEPPNDFHDDYIAKLQSKAFRPLSPIGDDESTVGWVTVQKPLEMTFQRFDIFFNQYILFALRIDKWALPSNIVNARILQNTELKFPKNDEPKKISKRAKEEIKSEVIQEMKLQSIPSMKIVDVLWNFTERKLQFYTVNKNLCEEFAELFEETFKLKLIPQTPYTLAKALDCEEEKLHKLVAGKPWFYDSDQ